MLLSFDDSAEVGRTAMRAGIIGVESTRTPQTTTTIYNHHYQDSANNEQNHHHHQAMKRNEMMIRGTAKQHHYKIRNQRRIEEGELAMMYTYAPLLTALLYHHPIDYNIGLEPRGQATVSFNIKTEDSTAFDATLEYSLYGISPNSNGSIYVAQGTTCDDNNEIGGAYDPYWNADVIEANPWLDQEKSYSSDEAGVSSGLFGFYNGYDHDDHYEHMVVLRDSFGARLACGVLMTDILFEPVDPVIPPGEFVSEVPSTAPSSIVVESSTAPSFAPSNVLSVPTDDPSFPPSESPSKSLPTSKESSSITSSPISVVPDEDNEELRDGSIPTASPVVSSDAFSLMIVTSIFGVCGIVHAWAAFWLFTM